MDGLILLNNKINNNLMTDFNYWRFGFGLIGVL